MSMPETVWYWKKRTQSGTRMLRYRTEIQDAGVPMPVASAWMPMPSYAKFIVILWESKPFIAVG
jgi:hypothetical protein